MTREEIVAFFNRRDAAWRAHDAAALAADHSANSIVVSPTGGVLEGRADIARIYRVWFDAFPDLTLFTEDLLIDGDRAALLGRLVGRHDGEFFGMPPTARRIEISFAFIFRFEDGLIAHERRILDFTGLLIQVGVLKAKPVGGL